MEELRLMLLGMTFTEALEILGIKYTVDFPSGGGTDITIPHQTIEQD